MKIHYRNFTRVGSNFDDPTFIPDRLKDKPRFLDIWEVTQFFASLAIAAYVIFTAEAWLDWLGIPVAIMFFVSAYLLAMESHWYRKASSLTVLVAICWIFSSTALEASPATSYSAILVLSIFAAGMYTTNKSKAYYAWCKSISKGA